MLRIGLIGYGSFGQLIERHLAPFAEFKIYDAASTHDLVTEVLARPIIILAIPAQFMSAFLHEHATELNPDALYVDVASVKIKPVKVMLEQLPESARVIATHPLFGPATAAESLAGRKIMVHPVRADDSTLTTFTDFLSGLGLHIIRATPEEHDRAMAYVQGLSHYIGRIMQQMDIPATQFATRAYDDLYDMKNVQGNDSDDLFQSILHENPYTLEVIDGFEHAMRHVDKKFDV